VNLWLNSTNATPWWRAVEERTASILPAVLVFCEQGVLAVVNDIALQTKPPLEYQPLFKWWLLLKPSQGHPMYVPLQLQLQLNNHVSTTHKQKRKIHHVSKY
jgi:hypothetical protein